MPSSEMADNGTYDDGMPILCDDEMCDHKTDRQAYKQSDQSSEVHAEKNSDSTKLKARAKAKHEEAAAKKTAG